MGSVFNWIQQNILPKVLIGAVTLCCRHMGSLSIDTAASSLLQESEGHVKNPKLKSQDIKKTNQ